MHRPSPRQQHAREPGVGPSYRFTFMAALAFVGLAGVLLFVGSAEAAPISGANADMSQVCWQTTSWTLDTTDANDADSNDVPLGYDGVTHTGNVFVFGMNYQFSTLYVDVSTAGTTGTTSWKYWNGAIWASLSGVTDGTNHFRDSGVNTVTWTMPTNWSPREIHGSDCPGQYYYLRALTGTAYTIAPIGKQVSTVEYNLKVKVQDELGTTSSFESLAEEDFTVADGTTTTIYDFRNCSSADSCTASAQSGVYELALDTAGADRDFNVKVAKDGYVTSSNLATGTVSTTLADKTGTPIELDFGNRVTGVTTEGPANALSSVSVTAGNSYGTTCSESGGAWYCAVPLADTSLAIQAEKDGYVTNTETAFASDRTAATDAQVTASVSSVKFAYKVTGVTTELSGALSLVTIETGDAYGVSCSESGGAWYCAVPVAHTGATIQATKDGYVQNTATSFASDRTANADAQVTASVSSVLFAVKVSNVQTEISTSLATVTVAAGDGFGTSCTESGGEWYCAVPLADTATDLRGAKDGYVTRTESSAYADRTAHADGQRTATISSVQHALKVTSVADELSNALSSVTVTAGDSLATSCTESAGAWYCPIPVAHTETDVKAAKDGYVTTTASSAFTDRTAASDAQVTATVTGVKFAYKVTGITTEASASLTSAAVKTGDGYATTCTASAGAWYCAVPLADTGVTIEVAKDGYLTHAGTSFASDRTSASDAQGAVAVSGVQYTVKVTISSETTLTGVTWQKKVGGGEFESATPTATANNVAYFAQSPSESDLVFEASKYSLTVDTGTAFDASSGTQTTKTLSLAASLTSLSTSAASTTAGAETTYTIGFTTVHAWPEDGKVVVTFPSGFSIGSPEVTLTGADGTATASVSSLTVTITRSTGSETDGGTAVTVALTQITNPTSTGATGTVSVTLQKNDGSVLDTGTAPAVTITAGSATQIAAHEGATFTDVTAGGTQTLKVLVQDAGDNAVESITVTWAVTAGGGSLSAATSATGSDGVATITLTTGATAGTNTVTATNAGLTGSPVTFTVTTTAGALATITVSPSGPSVEVDASQAFTASGADANGNSVSLSETWSASCGSITAGGAFTAPSTMGSCTVTATDGSVSGSTTVTVTAGSLSSLTTNAGNASTSATTTYTFGFTTEHAWPAAGKLAVTFPSMYQFGSATATLTGADGTATVSISSSVITVTRAGDGTQTAAATAITVAVTKVTNPASDGSSGTFTLSLQDASGTAINTGSAPAVSIVTNALSITGLTSSSHPASTWKAANALSLSWTAPTDSTVTGYSWGLDADPDDAVDGSSTAASVSSLGDGTHTFKVKAKNAAGDWGPIASYANIYVDTTAPAAPSVSSSTHTANACTNGASGTFSWGASDATSGLDASEPYRYALDGASTTHTTSSSLTLNALSDGSHTFTVTAYDRAGNSAGTTFTFKVDTSAPTLTLSSPAYTNVGDIAVSWTATDACSSVSNANIESRFASGAWTSLENPSGASGTFTLKATGGDGTYELRGRATDAIGNAGIFPSAAQASTVLDTVKPGVPGDVHAKAVAGGQARVEWSSATDAASGVAGYHVYRDGGDGSWTKLTSAPVEGLSYTYAGLSDGESASFRVAAVDRAGNEGDKSTHTDSVTVDASGPGEKPNDFAVDGYHDGVVAKPTIRLTWAPVAGVHDYAVYAGATATFALEPGNRVGTPQGTSLDLGAAAEGRHYFALVARDAVGNEGPAATLSFVLDSQAPTARAYAPSESGPAIAVAWTAEDAGVGVARVQLWVLADEAGPPQRFFDTDAVVGAVTYFGVEGQTYHFFAVAVDGLGQVEGDELVAKNAEATTRVVSNAHVVAPQALEAVRQVVAASGGGGGGGGPAITEPFRIVDKDLDGFPETFEDPNDALVSLRIFTLETGETAHILGKKVPQGSANSPIALWTLPTEDVAPVTVAIPVEEPKFIQYEDGRMATSVLVDKGGWIYIPVDDQAPHLDIDSVLRADGSALPPTYYWRDGDQIIVVDDPSYEYRVFYTTPATDVGLPAWAVALGTVVLLSAGFVAWVERPSVARLQRMPGRAKGVAWALRHCGACRNPLPRRHRLLRRFHGCGGFGARLESRRQGWSRASLAERVALMQSLVKAVPRVVEPGLRQRLLQAEPLFGREFSSAVESQPAVLGHTGRRPRVHRSKRVEFVSASVSTGSTRRPPVPSRRRRARRLSERIRKNE